ncbi:MAG: helix-turn-helix domain-containing protein [Lachnospiraceae bacterium]|nr:helix-turn-helix domain-containing protein [Lachnospiraceae bacterium]
MQLGKVIRTYRKKKGLTQEEVASRLGVTTPAVNKWENGVTYPDITLLAPIARLLDISLDTLLSFREELTTGEIENIIYEVDSRLKEKTYDEAFEWAKGKLEQYPNCEMLILEVAVILNGWCAMNGMENDTKYETSIVRWYNIALESDDEEVRTLAADSLFTFYLNKEDYDKAEEYLTYFSKQNPEKKRKQARIYSKTNRKDEAYKAYEELLFSMYQLANALFQEIYMLAMEEKNMDKAHAMVEKQSALAKVFEMGEYYEVSYGIELATVEKDADKVIDIMQRMLASIDEIFSFSKAPLYEHMTFRETREEYLAELKENLLKSFRDEETFGFLKGDRRWEEMK